LNRCELAAQISGGVLQRCDYGDACSVPPRCVENLRVRQIRRNLDRRDRDHADARVLDVQAEEIGDRRWIWSPMRCARWEFFFMPAVFIEYDCAVPPRPNGGFGPNESHMAPFPSPANGAEFIRTLRSIQRRG
jgi:hypothetical protein